MARLGRPITSTHPRAPYWREWKRRRKVNAGPPGRGWQQRFALADIVKDYRTLAAVDFIKRYPWWSKSPELQEAIRDAARVAPSGVGGTDG